MKDGVKMEGIWSSVDKLNTLGYLGRTVLVGIMLYIAGRFLPHRSGGQYAEFDFTFFWMMGGLIASPLFESKISFVNTIVAATTIYVMHYLISFFTTKSSTLAKLIYGKPEILIEHGKLNKRGMRKALMPIEMLLSQLREIDVPNINEVQTAIQETSGRISVQKKSEYMPVTPTDLDMTATEAGLPIILINDGKIVSKSLKSLGYDEKWLHEQLQKQGTNDLRNVYLATIDRAGSFYCSLSK
jgi:uncharacterized membrane protein YcaP (DUF421 family)